MWRDPSLKAIRPRGVWEGVCVCVFVCVCVTECVCVCDRHTSMDGRTGVRTDGWTDRRTRKVSGSADKTDRTDQPGRQTFTLTDRQIKPTVRQRDRQTDSRVGQTFHPPGGTGWIPRNSGACCACCQSAGAWTHSPSWRECAGGWWSDWRPASHPLQEKHNTTPLEQGFVLNVVCWSDHVR